MSFQIKEGQNNEVTEVEYRLQAYDLHEANEGFVGRKTEFES